MEISFIYSVYEYFTFIYLFQALMLTLLCSLVFLYPLLILVFSQSNKKACKCVGFSFCGILRRSDLMAIKEVAMANMVNGGGEVVVSASMMEQLVPEITTHVLSYLDYRSLCSLSMTNSSMRRAANDDNAWRALYHKDFTMEQDGITPATGWKGYYAATRTIVNINQRFLDIIRERSLVEMGMLWLNADYVKCVHAFGDIYTGYHRVMRSWQLAFDWELGIDFQVRDVSARVMTDIAWVTMKAYIAMDHNHNGLNLTNVFEFHNGQWYMVHHHCSDMLLNDQELLPL